MSAAPALSVLIPTYQRCAVVTQALQALAEQTLPPAEYEVVVVIDGSTDGTRERLAALAVPFALHVIWQPNRGRAAARNAALRQAQGEIVVMLDDDMQAAPGLLAGHRGCHVAGERVGVVGAAPVRLEPGAPPLAEYMGTRFNGRLERLARAPQTLSYRDAYIGNFSVRRADLLAIGGFDEAFTVYGYEDYELALRLAGSGVRLTYSAAALAYQGYDKDLRQLSRDMTARGRSAVVFAEKHPEAWDDLKFAQDRSASFLRRAVRGGLLAAGRVWPGVPAAVAAGLQQLERRRPRRLALFYELAIEYFYWLGAQAAVRENRRAGRGLQSLARPRGA